MSANDKDLEQPIEDRPEAVPEAPEWDPLAAFGEFPLGEETADPVPVEPNEAAPEVMDVAETPAFEMPPPDFALEFTAEAVSEEAVADESPESPEITAMPELPVELPEWDPSADFTASSFASTVAEDVVEDNAEPPPVVAAATPASELMDDIPEPVFEPFEPDEFHSPVAETVVVPRLTTGPSGLDLVLNAIDVEVAATEGTRRQATAAPAVLGASYVGFVHGAGRYAFAIEGITEITRSVRTTPVPFAPEWIVGVTNLRGDILAVADFGLVLGTGAVTARDSAYMIVLQGKRTPFSLGLLVDAVTGMKTLGEGDILTPTAPLADRVTQFAHGVIGAGAELTVVLDVEAFLALPEMQQFLPS